MLKIVDSKTIKSRRNLQYFDRLKMIPKITITCTVGALVEPRKISSSENTADVLRLVLEANRDISDPNLYYSFYCFYLSQNNTLKGVLLVGTGSASSCTVDVNKCLLGAVDTQASGVIVCSVHPSGNTKPSKQDKLLTDQLLKAFALFGVKLFDHVIHCPSHHEFEDRYYSFADDGLL